MSRVIDRHEVRLAAAAAEIRDPRPDGSCAIFGEVAVYEETDAETETYELFNDLGMGWAQFPLVLFRTQNLEPTVEVR